MALTRHLAGAGKLLTGMGLGAAAMYILDPELGAKRRHDLKDRGAKAVGTGGAALAALLEQARDGTIDASHKIRDQFDHLREQDVVEQLRHLAAGRRSRHSSREEHGTLALVGAALGAMAVGAGLMFLLDPQHGKVRRSLMRNKASRVAREARGYIQSARGGMAGQADSADSSVSDEELAARVRAEIASACTHPTDVYVSVRGDHIVLSGSLPIEEQEAVIARCQAIPGVARVVNNLTETATAT